MAALWKAMGWLCVGVIAILSLVPGTVRPHVLASGKAEHFVAYFLTALLLTIGYRKSSPYLLLGVGLSLYSGLLELFQIFIPGRESKFIDFVVSTIGATTGLCCAIVLVKILASANLRHR